MAGEGGKATLVSVVISPGNFNGFSSPGCEPPAPTPSLQKEEDRGQDDCNWQLNTHRPVADGETQSAQVD